MKKWILHDNPKRRKSWVYLRQSSNSIACREKGRGKNIFFRGVNVPHDNRGGHLRLQFVDSEGLLSVFSSGLVMQCARDAVLRNKLSLVRSGVHQCREINMKLAAIQVQRRVVSLVDRVCHTNNDVGSLLRDKGGKR